MVMSPYPLGPEPKAYGTLYLFGPDPDADPDYVCLEDEDGRWEDYSEYWLGPKRIPDNEEVGGESRVKPEHIAKAVEFSGRSDFMFALDLTIYPEE